MKKFKNCLQGIAFKPENSKGRRNIFPDDDEPLFDCVDPFRICIDKILNSKARRRLEEKTQVLCDPANAHARTRSRHTNEVVSFATKIADLVGLNVSLCQAISEGHDIEHTPYGHFGEEFISKTTGREFCHEIFGVVIAQHIERKAHGLNLSFEVLEGMFYHSRGAEALSTHIEMLPEHSLVMFADKITYVFSDVNDALRYNHLQKEDLPKELFDLGDNQRQRMLSCMFALMKESAEAGKITFGNSWIAQKFEQIRKWMYENYYTKMDWRMHSLILEQTYEFLSRDPFFRDCDPAVLLALMTDREVNDLASRVFIHGEKPGMESTRNFGIMEIIPHIRGKNIDFTDPDLNW